MTLAQQSRLAAISEALMVAYYGAEVPTVAAPRVVKMNSIRPVGWFCRCGTVNPLKEFVCSQCKGAKCPVTI